MTTMGTKETQETTTLQIEQIIRRNILSLKPYSCAREEFSGQDVTLLDANENPYDTGYNRYPDPYQQELKQSLARLKGVKTEQMVLGNGSDELIDMLIRTTCEPNRDNIIVFSPSYSMYEVSGHINAVEVRSLKLGTDFMPPWEQLFHAVDARTRAIFFCTPNNPTGNRWPLEKIREVADRFEGLVIVDEAYMDFVQGGESAVSLLQEFPRVVVLQTLSKAWGLAGLRIGICMGNPILVNYLNRVKPPYNIGGLTQRTALNALEDTTAFYERVAEIVSERKTLYEAFGKMTLFTKVYPSEANFLLLCTPQYKEVYDYLVAHDIVVRIRHLPPLIEGGLRITVGTPKENVHLLELLANYTRT
ncbi:histidinol-phosphate aminotransferase [Bacteroidia bacterium]|nr:histidinol-phosphate aminotransferase [Bacteroidia bacterium]